jgi:hypothetical protein
MNGFAHGGEGDAHNEQNRELSRVVVEYVQRSSRNVTERLRTLPITLTAIKTSESSTYHQPWLRVLEKPANATILQNDDM